jgi:flagellar biosynthesis protein FlhA
VRKKFAQDVGFLPPPVHIRDNLELKPSPTACAARRRGGRGRGLPRHVAGHQPRRRHQQLPGTRTTDPAFGLPAVWIDERQRERPK